METILQAFETYLDSSTPPNFIRLRQAVAASLAYHPNDDNRRDAEDLLEAEKWDEALRLLMADMENCFLTPRCHFLAAFAAQKFGDEKKARIENSIGAVLMEAILASGDGTKSRPYLVSRITDEYDVLQYLEKSLKRQSLMSNENGTFDVMECTDDTEYWFDISMLFNRLNELSGKPVTGGETGTIASFVPNEEAPPEPAQEPWWKFGKN